MSDRPETPSFEAIQRASALKLAQAAAPAAAQHFDELRARLTAGAPLSAAAASLIANYQSLSPTWSRFFASCENDDMGTFDQRSATLERQIRDNGVTYNVYADEGGPQRPWSVGLFPLILTAQDWTKIAAGVTQRVQLLEHVMADVYGPQTLVAQGLLPSALVHGHPGYLRAMHGVQPVGGKHLHIAAFDLARGPDGNWWVVSQRTQAPSGLGYLMENRLAVSRLFPQAFESLQVQRLAGTYRALMQSMRALSPAGEDAHIAVLTPGPFNETYFEHAYLARYLGLTLVEGSDLTVRDQHLFLKTLRGLVPIHGLLKRLDDQFLDPLELRSDSTLGVAGLLQVIRAGNVLVANAPGSAFLESPALLGFLPALSRHLLGEELHLPALPTWWCGERSAMEQVLGRLQELAIKPTYPGSRIHGNFDAVLGHNLSSDERLEWAARIQRRGDDHTIQAFVPLSQIPTWQSGKGAVAMRSVILRVFAVSDGADSWRVLPGGLARVAGGNTEVASMQRGGSSADVWAITHGVVDKTTLLRPALTPSILAQRKRLVTSRAAENLFWMGRYTERAENSVRLARIILDALSGEDQCSEPLLGWLNRMAINNTLVEPDTPDLTPQAASRRDFERSLITSLDSKQGATSVGYTLRCLRLAGSAVRERLSQEHWGMMLRTEEAFSQSCTLHLASADFSSLEALGALHRANDHLAAITGLQTDRMTRDDGWRLLSIGRHIERLGFLSSALRIGVECQSIASAGGFEAMVSLFDSTITFHAQYQQSRDLAALLDLLVQDRDNPRALAWVAHSLRSRMIRLAGSAAQPFGLLTQTVPDPTLWPLETLCAPGEDGSFASLTQLLHDCSESAYQVSEAIGATYFSHADDAGRSLGA